MKLKNNLLKGAIVLSFGGIITKVIGAIYRVPLTNLLGADGIGIYQMAFPTYCILLTLSSTGVPNGISKLIAEGEDGESVLKSSLCIFSVLGIILSILMAILSNSIAILQGDARAKLCYLLLSPSVFLVSVISCFRGYHQGLSNMKPTATSQVIEQVVKLVFGLSVCYLLRNNVVLASAGATLAVTASELFALLYLIKISKKNLNFSLIKSRKVSFKPIILNVLPIMLATLILPIVRTVDSFLILNILSTYKANATTLYGLYSGAVESIVSLPISVCYTIGVSAIPIISKAKKQNENYFHFIYKSMGLTLVLSILFASFTFLFSNFAINFLYKSLSYQNREIAIKMLKLSSLSILFLSLMQTTVCSLNAIGKYKVTIFTSVVSAKIKITFSCIFLKINAINVFGAILSDILCYFVACFINLSYIIYSGFIKNKKSTAI